jgi:hypothetical protein
MGIEPTSPAWKAGALPLSYSRMSRHNATLNNPHLSGNGMSRSTVIKTKMLDAIIEPART